MVLRMLIFLILFQNLLGTQQARSFTELNENKDPGEDTKNWVDSWVAPDVVKHKFLYYISGYDYDGRPILVLPWGNWDTRTIVEKGGENVQNLEKYFDQLVQRILRGAFTRPSNNETEDIPVSDELVVIVDFDDLNLRQITLPENFRFLVKNVAKINLCFEKIAYGFAINVNSVAAQMMEVVRPTLARFLEKVNVYGTITSFWKPILLKTLPADQLHPAYGGPKDFRPVKVYG
ncbi:unnamed protein product [Allacma fusca]|uniref:CRAL-TRIO domain-containing protein n=1 Tax=Allacma fusca TaxID=39272 RepID=A0A8J2PF97_9HEXA|nr:unnamed protein product [Allacma fusca]